MRLPRSEQEYCMFSLEHKSSPGPFVLKFTEEYVGKTHPNSITNMLVKWAEHTKENFPELFVTVEEKQYYNIYIAGVWITTVYKTPRNLKLWPR